MAQLAYILSLPRSGSTVLSVLLDRKFGIVSPPESAFPQVLGAIGKSERQNRRWLAALYFGSTFTPTPLSMDDAEQCMEGDNDTILTALGKAVAVKLDRDPSEVRCVVWKTPRMVGMHKGPLASNGRFIILRRNPQNVFESQFRVGFGENNRNPYRFAAFRESYEHAFSRLPTHRVYQVEYDSLPGSIPSLMSYLGLEDKGDWEIKRSSLDMAAESCPWMADVTGEFKNTDPEKRARLDKRQVDSLNRAMMLVRPIRRFMGPVRAFYDNCSMRNVRRIANQRLRENR